MNKRVNNNKTEYLIMKPWVSFLWKTLCIPYSWKRTRISLKSILITIEEGFPTYNSKLTKPISPKSHGSTKSSNTAWVDSRKLWRKIEGMEKKEEYPW